MNYTYKIKNSIKNGGIVFLELLDSEVNNCWYPINLRNEVYLCFEKTYGNSSPKFCSLERTRSWVVKNHPELLI